MKLSETNNIYFLGIGGIGMSALARYFMASGKFVAGYDLTETSLTKKLKSEGAKINYEDNLSVIPELIKSNKRDALVIYTPAVPKENVQYEYFENNDYIIVKRAKVLGMISADFPTIAVAGTHGKTTISTIAAHIFKTASRNSFAFLGGISKNYNTNLLLPEKKDKDAYLIAEADEFDRSFLHLYPKFALITAIDADHLDIYENELNIVNSFNDFIRNLDKDGVLIINEKINKKINADKKQTYTYGVTKKADFYCDNLVLNNGIYFGDVVTPQYILKNIQFGAKGFVNIENSIAALSIAYCAGIERKDIKNALETFQGVNRRFDFHIHNDKIIYIDDYAHHPEEIKALINSVKQLFPGKKITGIFQPHLYSRTKDFADEFAESLNLLNELILLPIYPAREKEIKGVNSELLLKKVKINEKQIIEYDNLVKYLWQKDLEVCLTIGAGNIDQLVKSITNTLNEKYSITE